MDQIYIGDDGNSVETVDISSVVVIEINAVVCCCKIDVLGTEMLLKVSVDISGVVDVITILTSDTTPAVAVILASAALPPPLRRPDIVLRSG